MTRKKAFILIVLVLILASSCSSRLSEGTIVYKEYKPQRILVSYIYLDEAIIPQQIVYPEAYIITIKGIVDGKEVITTRSIPSYLYDKVSVGEWWKDDFLN